MKRYMDFIPSRSKTTSTAKITAKTTVRTVTFVQNPSQPIPSSTLSSRPSKSLHQSPTQKPAPAPLGVIEDYHSPTPPQPSSPNPPRSAVTSKTFVPPKNPFINTERITKRPLSKNVYKKIVVPKPEPSDPITIIEPPHKDSQVGLIVTIILTIILGATAGTIAFLLLPR